MHSQNPPAYSLEQFRYPLQALFQTTNWPYQEGTQEDENYPSLTTVLVKCTSQPFFLALDADNCTWRLKKDPVSDLPYRLIIVVPALTRHMLLSLTRDRRELSYVVDLAVLYQHMENEMQQAYRAKFGV